MGITLPSWEDVLRTLEDPTAGGPALPGGVLPDPNKVLESIGKGIPPELNPIIGSTIDGAIGALPEEMAKGVRGIEERLKAYVGEAFAKIISGLLAVPLGILTGSATVLGVAVGTINAYKDAGQVHANYHVHPKPLDPFVLLPAVYRRALSAQEYIKEGKRNGYSEARMGWYMDAMRPALTGAEILAASLREILSESDTKDYLSFLGYEGGDISTLLALNFVPLNVAENVTLWLREDITENELESRVKKLGYRSEAIQEYKKLAFYIPPVPDLVRMSVREVFSPADRQRLDLDSEYPDPFTAHAKRQGVSLEWAKNYWAAHWELPSPTQVYEMLHRGILDEDGVRKYLKAADYAPTWREPLMQISYNPLTRVDVRRMYALGVLKIEDVKKAYKDLGYNEENAQRLSDFVAVDTVESQIGTVKSKLLTLFRKGIVSEEELRAFLASMSLPPNLIDVLVAQEEMLAAAEIEEKRVNAVRTQYFKGVISLAEVGIKFAGYGVPGVNIPGLLATLQEEKLARVTRITIKDLKEMFNQHLMSEDDFRRELKERNLRDKDIDLMVSLSGSTTTEQEPPPPEV